MTTTATMISQATSSRRGTTVSPAPSRRRASAGILTRTAPVARVIMATLGYEVASRSLATRNLAGLGVLVGISWTYVLSVRLARRLARRFRKQDRSGEGDGSDAEQSEAIVDAVGQVVGALMTLLAFAALQYFTGTVGRLVRLLDETEIMMTADGDWLTAWGVVLALLSVSVGHLIASQTSRVYEQVIIPLVGEGERGARFALLTFSMLSPRLVRAKIQATSTTP